VGGCGGGIKDGKDTVGSICAKETHSAKLGLGALKAWKEIEESFTTGGPAGERSVITDTAD